MGLLQQKQLNIVYKNIPDLKAAKYNPRKISETQFTHLKNSLSTFECVELIVMNRLNAVIKKIKKIKEIQ